MTDVDWDVVVIGRGFGGLSAILTRAAAGRGGAGFRITFDGETVTASGAMLATGVSDDTCRI